MNQTVTVGADAPTSSTASALRERLQDVNGAWLIDAFNPM
jgi:hypothetical protein